MEVKAQRDRAHPIDGESGRKAMAVQEWVGLSPKKLKHEMVFATGDPMAYNQMDTAASS